MVRIDQNLAPESATVKRRRVLWGLSLVLAVPAVAAFAWIEWRELARIDTAQQLEAQVQAVALEAVDASLEGRLVYLRGTLQSVEPVRDVAFGLQVPALRLVRSVEMLQWQRVEAPLHTQPGASPRKVQSYIKQWSSAAISSASFDARHQNPTALPWLEHVATAPRAQLGAYALGEEGLLALSDFAPLRATAAMRDQAPLDVRDRLHLDDGALYWGADPNAPAIGDCRVRFQAVWPQAVSVMAKQAGAELVALHGESSGAPGLWVEPGALEPSELLRAATPGDGLWPWLWRALAVLGLGAGLSLALAAARFGEALAPRGAAHRLALLGMAGASVALTLAGVGSGLLWWRFSGLGAALGAATALLGAATLVALTVRARRLRAT